MTPSLPTDPPAAPTYVDFADHFSRMGAAISRVVVGQESLVEEVLVALFARGHVLIEGVPGLGKTLLVRALARALSCTFRRIQFTPDLMPSDITGGNIFDSRENRFQFVYGPVFAQILLADEINRAPAKTQAALLEAMQERQVTIDGIARPLPKPFITLATQNPIESQGTYALPEAQLDRFLFKVIVKHPSPETEKEILRLHLSGLDPADFGRVGLEPLADENLVLAMQDFVGTIRVDDSILDYIVRLVGATRTHRSVFLGASPRASVALVGAARVRAAIEGRDFVVPDDVKDHAPSALRHRLGLHPDAELEGVTPDEVIESLLKEVPVPAERRMIPTGRLALCFAGGLFLAVCVAFERLLDMGSHFIGPLVAWDAAVAGIALVDLATIWRVKVEARRTVPAVLSVGRPNPAGIHLRSRMRRTIRLDVTDDGAAEVVPNGVPTKVTLAAGAQAVWRYSLTPSRRGAHQLGNLWLRVASPFGLWQRQVRIPAAQTVRVYPDLQAVRVYEKLVREARDERFTRVARRRGGESEFERLREYTRDDDVRRIDWKATARRRLVIVREYQLEQNQNVVFLLDLGRLMTAETRGLSHLDHALNATLMLSHVSVRAGDHVGLVAFDANLRTFVPPEGGANVLKKIVRATYDLFPSLVEPDYRSVFATIKTRLRKRSLLVLFTQVLDVAAQKQLVPLIRSLAPTHLPLCVVFRDDSVEDLLAPNRLEVPDLYTRGAAAAELLWREHLVEDMRRAGALVLYVHPAELTQQLIARYLDIKARQLL